MEKSNEFYYFDEENLSYKRIKTILNIKRIRKFFNLSVISLVISIILIMFTNFYAVDYLVVQHDNRVLMRSYHEISLKVDSLETILEIVELKDDSIYRNFLELDPVPSSYRLAGVGGTDRYAEYRGYGPSNLIVGTLEKVDLLIRKTNLQITSYDQVLDSLQSFKDYYSSIPAILPVKPYHLRDTLISPMGYRIHPILGERIYHKGIDLSANSNTGTYASGAGTVSKVIESNSGYGNHVVIDHGHGYTSLYAHLNAINVIEGQRVERGELIGLIGSTGLSTAPHLHYEVRLNNKPVDPTNYIGNFSYGISDEIYGGF